MTSKTARFTATWAGSLKRTCAPRLDAAASPPEVDTGVDRLDGGVTGRLDPALLDDEEIGEVGIQLQLDRAVGRLLAVVGHHDVLAHAPADVAIAHERERAVRPPGAGPGAEHEAGAEGVGAVRGQRLGLLPVDAQLEAGEEPGVAEEEAVGPVGQDVAGPRRDAERRPLHQRHRAGGSAERGALPLEGPRVRHLLHPTAATGRFPAFPLRP